MTHRFRVRALGASTLLAVVLVAAACTAGPGASDGKAQILTAAGSDTTQDVMTAILHNFQVDATNNKNAEDTAINIPAVPTAGLTVPAEPAGSTTGNCGARTYVAAGTPPASYTAPNGSGAGKTALLDPANLTSTCIDIARSSSGPSSATDPATLEYYAFARDAVSWNAFTGNAPATLTKQQLKDIYACNVTNWNQVGGGNGTIVRYLPQASSGTRKFFIANILDNETLSETCGAIKLIEENTGDQVAAADRANAIEPYSAGQWIAQKNVVITDHTAGSTVRSITTSAGAENPVQGPTSGKYAPNPTVVNGTTFPGVRYVYNVLDSRLPSYKASLRVVGFTSSNQSSLCSGGQATTLSTYGFTPLTAVNGVTCLLQRP